MKRPIFLLLLLSLLSVSCQKQLDQVADNSGTAGEENGNNPIQEVRLSGVEGVFKFRLDEREWRLFEMEYKRVESFPEDLVECEELEGSEHEDSFDEMYVRFNKDEGGRWQPRDYR